MTLDVSFVTAETLPSGVLFSAYLGVDGQYFQQVRALSNGTTQTRYGDEKEWTTR